MSGVTDIVRRSRITPVLAVLLAFIAMDLSVLLAVVLKEMQAKSQAGALDVFDWALLLTAMVGCVGKTVAAYMNKGWTRYADERDAAVKEERRAETELRARMKVAEEASTTDRPERHLK